jgi:rRNA processing protein Krr1/Pno1
LGDKVADSLGEPADVNPVDQAATMLHEGYPERTVVAFLGRDAALSAISSDPDLRVEYGLPTWEDVRSTDA